MAKGKDGNAAAEELEGMLAELDSPPAEGVVQIEELPKMKAKTDWKSIYLCTLCQFFSAAQFSLFFMSMFPFLKMLAPNNTEAFYGILIAVYSLAQVISSPLVGWFSNCMGGRVRLILIGLEAFMMVGNCLYFLVELFPRGWARILLMIARFFVGIGMANIGLLKSYVSVASTSEDRSKAIALLTSGHALGTTFGPVFQMAFSWIGIPGLRLFGSLHLSMFTAPALFAAILNVLNFVFLKFYFRENYANLIGHKNNGKKIQSTEDGNGQKALPSYDHVGTIVCYAVRFFQTLVFTNLQTLGASFAMLMFSWSATEVVRFGSLAHAAKGMIMFVVYLAYILLNLGKHVNERLVCFFSLLALLSFHLATFSWHFLPEEVEIYNGKLGQNGTATVRPGCDESQFGWCHGLKRVDPILFNTLYALIFGISFPNIHVGMNTLFSKMIGPRLQGTEQGIMQMAGGIGRLVGPLIVGYLYTWEGPRAVWILEICAILVISTIWLIAYPRLIPLKITEKEEEVENEPTLGEDE